MKPQFKTALVVLGIILGTIIGVSLLYNIFTSWEKRRCLINQHTVVIPAHRGDILDKNGKILATERIDWRFRVNVGKVTPPRITRLGGYGSPLRWAP